MLSIESREVMGPLKIRRQRAPRQPKKDAKVVGAKEAGKAHEATDDAD